MGNCTKSYCNGTLTLWSGLYGPYWRCSKCKHTIGKLCACGGARELIILNGSNVARCNKCNKFRY